ncbi:MAG: hypothetical protein ACPGR7_03595 [Flavobacteriaceae bacterium]
MKQGNATLGNTMSQFNKFMSYNFKGLTFWQLVLVNIYMFLALFFFAALVFIVFTQGI